MIYWFCVKIFVGSVAFRVHRSSESVSILLLYNRKFNFTVNIFVINSYLSFMSIIYVFIAEFPYTF